MRNSFKLLSVVIIMFCGLIGHSQQDPLFTQYMFNTMSINPGYAGSAGFLSVNAISRHQWIGFDGAPSTQTFAAHAPVREDLGIGLSLINDNTGPISNLSIEANFSYILKLTEASRLSFGLMGGFNNIHIGLLDLEGVDPEDAAFHYDINNYRPIFGAGLYYYHPRGYIGFSIPDLIETEFEEQVSTWKHDRHYFFIAGYITDLSDDIKLRPTAMLRYVQNMPLSIEGTASLIFRDRVWFGLMYRHEDAVGAILCLQLNQQIRLGYSYDYGISQLSSYQSGSHEIMLNYDFNYGRKDYVSPRYF